MIADDTDVIKKYYPLVDIANGLLSRRSQPCSIDDVRRMLVNELKKLGTTRSQAIDDIQQYIDSNEDNDNEDAMEIMGVLDM